MRQMLQCLMLVFILLGLLVSPAPLAAQHADSAPEYKAGAAVAVSTVADSPPAGPTIVAADDQRIVLEWAAPAYEIVEDTVDGRAVQRIDMPDCAPAGRPGEPELPVCTALLGVPPDSAVELRILEIDSVPVPGTYHLAPVPEQVVEYRLPLDFEAVPAITMRGLEGAAYTRDDPFPSSPVRLAEDAFLRHQRIVALAFYPLQYRPQAGELYYNARLRVEINFAPGSEAMGYVAESPSFEGLLERALLNYAQARAWRRTAVQPLDLPPAPPDPGYRIPVQEEGLYRLSYEWLHNNGVPVQEIGDAHTLRLLRYGQEVAIQVLGEEDGVFGPGDAILFYGRPLQRNRFTDAEIYWLTYNGPTGLRMPSRDGTPRGTAPIPPSFLVIERLETNLIYFSQMPWRPDHDHWFWNRTFPEAGQYQQTYNFPPRYLASELYTSTLRLYLYSYTQDPEVNPDHHIRILFNNLLIDEHWWDGQTELTMTYALPSTLLQSSGNTVRIESPGDTGAFAEVAYYDWLELAQRRSFIAEGGRLSWEGDPGQWEYHPGNFPQPEIVLLDISAVDNPVEIVSATVFPAGSSYALHFEDNVTQTTAYAAYAAGTLLVPASIAQARPADLRDPANGADYIVITHGDFYTQAQSLAAFRAGQGLRAMVVDVQDVYDLFGYGRRDAAAVRDLLAYAYATWAAPAPSYVVLLGDGHYDPKNYKGSTQGQYILPYLAWVDPWLGETAADNRYVCVSGDDALPDMHLGRLPANTAAEAQIMVNKILAYESTPPPGAWRQQALFVADNADQAGNFAALSDALIAGYYPAPYQAERVYLGVTHPYQNPSVTARNAIVATINQGQLLVNYIGHGASWLWAAEKLLDNPDLVDLHNSPFLPVALPMTCYEGTYHLLNTNPTYYSLAETYLRAAGKGWIASWSPTGLGVATGHHYLNEGFLRAAFLDDVRQLGPATLAGKLRLFQTGYSLDLLDTYLLFGDPALEMPLLETDLALDKAVEPAAPLRPGDPITFTLSLSAAGPATAHHVVLTDTLSPYLVSPTVRTAGLTLTPRPDTRYTWDAADLAAGQSGVVTISAHLSWQTPAGTYVNQARVATTAKETDLQNNAALVSFQVVAGPPYAIQVAADPPALPADGASLADIRAHVVDTAGNAVADGTTVVFRTDHGAFFDGSTHYTGTTAQGNASVFLRAASQIVTATVTVAAGPAVGQVQVPFLSTDPHTVVVAAWPTAIPVTGTAAITATVRDILDHPVQDGTGVTLTTTLGALTPTLGATRGGIVTATLHGEGQAGLAAIVARSGGAAGAAQVRLGTGSDYTLTLAVTPTALPADGQATAALTATLVRADGQPITTTHRVTFSATLGQITPTVRLAVGGVATATLTAGTRAGSALLVATAEREAAWAAAAFLPGPAAVLTLTVSPASIPVGGASAVAAAAVRDAYGNRVADGTPVAFSTSLGTITPTAAVTLRGEARAVLLSGTTAGTATVAAGSGPAGGAAAVRFVPLGPFTVTLTATPTTVVADGQTPAALSAWVSDRYGNAVADGTMVELYTTLGTLRPAQAGTVQGWATAALTSTAVGTATVQCFVGAGGDAQAQAAVRFTAGPPAALLVTANPGRILANGVTTSTITVYLWDAWNHPVADGTLATLNTSRGTIDPETVATANGRAAAVLRSAVEPGWAVVQARSGPAEGTAWVEFYMYRVYLPLIVR